jgi:hypothetical protein
MLKELNSMIVRMKGHWISMMGLVVMLMRGQQMKIT